MRVLDVVDKPLGVRFPAGEFHALDRPVATDFRGFAAVLEVVGVQVLGEFDLGGSVACLEQRDLHAGFRQGLGNPPAGRTRADDDGIVHVVFPGEVRLA